MSKRNVCYYFMSAHLNLFGRENTYYGIGKLVSFVDFIFDGLVCKRKIDLYLVTTEVLGVSVRC